MPATKEFQEERAELDALLRSGIFSRAPNLVSFLTYVCERYFQGGADQIKEYTIGVEALGRGSGFDPKQDSIVRVEAHRLRKRLSSYYCNAGADHEVQIGIPSGQYIPQFIYRDSTQGAALPSTSAAEAEPVLDAVADQCVAGGSQDLQTVERPAPRFYRKWTALLAAIGAIALGLMLISRSALTHTTHLPPGGPEIWKEPSTGPVAGEFRMLAGYHGPPFTDRQGHTWTADAYFTGGRSSAIPPDRMIEGILDPHLLKAERSGTFRYDVPLGKGMYELHLYFAETEYGPGNPMGGADSSRTFRVSINGVVKLDAFDPLAESGAPNRLHERVFKDISPDKDGKLHLVFEQGSGPAFLNGVELLPSAPGRMRPVRIVAQDRPLTDADGVFWSADEYFSGGSLVLRQNTILDPRQRALYRGERFGHFAYRIPLAPGKYRLTLHFAETWFGSPESHQPALGCRVFNVFANGVALLENFEIAKEASVNHAVIATFRDLQPNAQGVLSLDFVPIKNYAEVNAIEVVETE